MSKHRRQRNKRVKLREANNQPQGDFMERSATLVRNAEGDDVYYNVALSSEKPVVRYSWREDEYYDEVLVHKREAIDLERAADGLVFLFNHITDQPIGRVYDVDLRGDGVLAGRVRFSESKQGQEYRQQVDDGTLKDVSIRYAIERREWHDKKEGEDRAVEYVTNWSIQEASLVTIPADTSVGIGRSQKPNRKEELKMSKRQSTPDGDNGQDDGVVVNMTKARKLGEKEGATLERERQNEIDEIFDFPRYSGALYQELRTQLKKGSYTIDECRGKLLELVGKEVDGDDYRAPEQQRADSAVHTHKPVVRLKEDRIDNQYRGLELALGETFGLLSDSEQRDAEQSEFRGLSLAEIARVSVSMMGVDSRGMTLRDVVGYAMNPLAIPAVHARNFYGAGTSVFTALVENIANKKMQAGFNEQLEVWRELVRIGQVSGFNQESRVDFSSFSGLDEIPEGSPYKRGSFVDGKEYIQAKKYGKEFGITREMIITNDIMSINRIPQEMGRAADRKIGDLVAAIFTGNPNLQDGTALFHSSRGNIISSGAGSPSVTQLDKMETAMATRKDANAAAHGQNISPSVLYVPKALKKTAIVLQNAAVDPEQLSSKNSGGTVPNPYADTFKVLSDARLDAASTTQWYATADPAIYDTIEVAFIDGNETPDLESQNGWSVDGVDWKVRLEVAAAALQGRTMMRNNGA